MPSSSPPKHPLPPKNPHPLSEDDYVSCQRLLQDCEMFHRLSPSQIATLASHMQLRTLGRNETLLTQGQPSESFFLLAKGAVRREFLDPETGKSHNVEFEIKAKSINSMRVLSGDPIHATVKCMGDHLHHNKGPEMTNTNNNSNNNNNHSGSSAAAVATATATAATATTIAIPRRTHTANPTSSSCELYEMPRQRLLQLLHARPDIAIQIGSSLSDEVRTSSKKYATPLLEQKQQQLDVTAVMIAAGIESYYRSALNAQINRVLTGVKGEWFPNMHIQVPVRIAYIAGFKGLRTLLDNRVDADTYTSAQTNWIRLGMALAPGVLMTPVSSLLEASNAGHLNNEPMTTRWMRGISARCGREVIFGLGLNQLSDYLEERWQTVLGRGKTSPILANAAGSISAGVISGYLSHVPHNLSTYKLLEPRRSYGELYRMFVNKSVPPSLDRSIQQWDVSPKLQQAARYTAATLFPRGLVVRTVQIVGSFMILNGTINYLQLREHQRLHRANTTGVSGGGSGSGGGGSRFGSSSSGGAALPKIAFATPIAGGDDDDADSTGGMGAAHASPPRAATLQRIVSRPD